MHIDVSVAREQVKARLDAAVAAGGRIVDDSNAPSTGRYRIGPVTGSAFAHGRTAPRKRSLTKPLGPTMLREPLARL
jgi:hypothetical protein